MYRIFQADHKRLASMLQSRQPLDSLDADDLPIFLDSLAGLRETLILRKLEAFEGQDVLLHVRGRPVRQWNSGQQLR